MSAEDSPKSITVHYQKSSLFRVIHADGVWGGMTPRAMIQMVFWNERTAIPKNITFSVDPEKGLGDEMSRESKEGFVRELEAEILMDLRTAKSFHEWLGDKIRKTERIIAEQDSSITAKKEDEP